MTPAGALAITNAVIVTVDGSDRVVEGRVIVEHGVITAIGADVAIPAGATTIDADGAIVMPGLVNTHTHLAMTLFRGLADDLDLHGFLERLLPAELNVIDADTVEVGTRLAAAECLAGGVTTALDMYWLPDVVLVVAAETGLRTRTGPVFMEFDGPDRLPFAQRMKWAERWMADTPDGERWVAPHSAYLLTKGQLHAIAALAADTGARINVHCAETPIEVGQVGDRHGGMSPAQVLLEAELLTDRTVLAHGVHLSATDIAIVADAGASVAHNPASNLKLASGIAPVTELRAAGVNVSLGTDGSASANDLDMWVAMRLAAYTQKNRSGAETMTAHDIVHMATIDGARSLGIDHLVGSIEVGKRADLVVLDANSPSLTPSYHPYSTVAFAAGRGDVRHVVADGRVVVRDRELMTIDIGATVAAARNLQARVLRS